MSARPNSAKPTRSPRTATGASPRTKTPRPASGRPSSARPNTSPGKRPGTASGRSSSPRKSSSMTNIAREHREVGCGVTKEPQFDAGKLLRMYLRGRPVTCYLPSDTENYNIKAKDAAPTEQLKLDWVYGYRGKDSRFNLYFLPTGEIIYFMAAVVVLHNVEDGVQRHYTGHNDDVKSLAIHSDKVTIATGQVAGHDPEEGSPHVRVWDSVSLNTLHVIGLGIFDRAVCCIGFSKIDGGTHLAAVDDSNEHVLSVWDWAKGKKLYDVKSSQDPVVQCEFHPNIEKQVITLGKGHIHFWSFESGKMTKKSGIFEKRDKPKFVLCMAFTSNGDVITGDSNGNVFIWGKGGSRISHERTGAHEGPIFSIVTLPDGGFLTGGGKDKKIKSWDSSYDKTGDAELPDGFGAVRALCPGPNETIFVGTTRNAILKGELAGSFDPVVQAHTDELWGLGIHPNQALFLTCAYDKNLIMWDAESHKPLWTKVMEDSLQSAGFHPSGNVIAIGTKTGRWLALDTQSQDLITVHTDGNEQHDIIRFSPDGNYLAVASHDNFIYVYSVAEEGKKFTKVGKCSGHSSFITHIDWSTDSKYIQSNSGDYEMLFWIAETCKQETNAKDLRDIMWNTYTCVLGHPVLGIWPEGSDGTDVNTVARSNNANLIATGDDFGKVKLFKYPASHPKASCNAFKAHSSHVTSVDFFPDDTTLISTGGRDMSVMQWKVV